jgi:hypothetical protein
MATKVVIMVKVMDQGGDWMSGVDLMFDDETKALFSAIVSFWFGNRAVAKFMGKK